MLQTVVGAERRTPLKTNGPNQYAIMTYLNDNCETFKKAPLKQLHHMYDTLNAHVYSAFEQNLVVKLAKT